MKKLRKVNKEKRKAERRKAEQLLTDRTALLLDHPKECCICKAAFERTKETVKTWRVTVRQEAKRVRLTCPTCSQTIHNFLERRKDES